ncbi:MAG: hypothetical protein ACEQSN_10885 [Yersinia sp. (in: enterobacteria)]
MLSEEQKLQIKMSMNDKWQLVKLTHVWPDGHLINQMAHALIERNAELLSLREQLAELKALPLFTEATPATTVVPEGYKFVPIKLTPTMRLQMHTIGDVTCHECGTRLSYDCTDNIEYSWADILEATPEVPNAK